MAITIGNIPTGANVDSAPLNTIFTNYGNEINRIGGYLPTGTAAAVATPAGTANTIALRDANGSATFTGLSVVNTGAIGGIGISGVGTPTGAYVAINAPDSSNVFSLLASKAAAFGGTVSMAATLAVTGLLSGHASLFTAPDTVTPSVIARGVDTSVRKVLSLQNSAGAEGGYFTSDGTGTLAGLTLTTYAGGLSTSAWSFAGFVYPATPASLVVNIAPGVVWNGATYIANAVGGSVTYGGGGGNPALPITNARIDVLGYNSSSLLQVVTGSESATPAPPALPTAFTPLAYIKIRPGATQITALGTTDTGTQSFVYADIRAHVANPTGIGPTGSYPPLTASYITENDETGAPGMTGAKRLGAVLVGAASLAQPAGITSPATGGSAIIRSGYRSNTDFDATLANLMRNRVSYNLQTRPHSYCNKASATTWQLVATSTDPIGVDANGTWRVIGATISSAAFTGSAGVRYVCADTITGGYATGPTFGLTVLTAPPSPNSGQICLCAVWWDGTAIQDEMVDYSYLGIKPLYDTINGVYGYIFTKTDTTLVAVSTTVNTPTYNGTMALGSQKTLYVPRGARYSVTGGVRFANNVPTAITTCVAAPVFNNSTAGWPYASVSLPASGVWDAMATLPDYGFYLGAGGWPVTICGMLVAGTISGTAAPNMTASWLRVRVD